MKKVIVYSTPTCVYCNMAKDYFKQNGVKYEEYNVGADRTKLKEMTDKSGQMGVPVIDIDGTIIVGFDRGQIAELLGIKS